MHICAPVLSSVTFFPPDLCSVAWLSGFYQYRLPSSHPVTSQQIYLHWIVSMPLCSDSFSPHWGELKNKAGMRQRAHNCSPYLTPTFLSRSTHKGNKTPENNSYGPFFTVDWSLSSCTCAHSYPKTNRTASSVTPDLHRLLLWVCIHVCWCTQGILSKLSGGFPLFYNQIL